MTFCRFKQRFPARRDQIPVIKIFVEKKLAELKIPDPVRQDVVLATDEAATNIVLHAYKEENPEGIIIVSLCVRNGNLEVELLDQGGTFDPGKVPKPDINENLKGRRQGGFGVHLMKSLMDKIVYRTRKSINVTKLIKSLEGQGKNG